MCGIIGYVGKKNSLPILIKGLKSLEYRGYDSSGIAYLKEDKIKIIKEEGKVSILESNIDFNDYSNIGIAHTRWATHGVANKINAHPHSNGLFTIVHNGIIENYKELKTDLEKKNYKFLSDTDSEVIAVLLNELYKENDILNSIIKLKEILKGSYALAIICEDIKDKIFAIKKESPLILAKCDIGSFLASDIPAILDYTNYYSILLEDEIAILQDNEITVLNNNLESVEKELLKAEILNSKTDKQEFDHFMLKEIYEEKDVIKNLTKDFNSLEKLEEKLSEIKNYKKIDIVACGSAYHVGLIAKNLIEEYANIPVNTEVASEYRYKNNFLDKDTLVIFISQSGETADSIAALKKVKEQSIKTLGIVNVEGSSIARMSDIVIYTKAGPEIAVATTKAFISQVVTIIMITLYLGLKNNKLTEDFVNSTLNELQNLDNIIDNLLKEDYITLANKLKDKSSIFFIGRKIDYAIALEASLKLKEISYIHSEAYPAGELKHGTISLIENDTPVIAIITDSSIEEKTISNIKEVAARNAYTISLSPNKINDVNKEITIPKSNNLIYPITAIIPLQLIAYHTARLKGCDIDKPRNLAKSVTVE